jgi:hypothetical protein
MFEKLKGVAHRTKVVTLIVKGEEYDYLGISKGFRQSTRFCCERTLDLDFKE